LTFLKTSIAFFSGERCGSWASCLYKIFNICISLIKVKYHVFNLTACSDKEAECGVINQNIYIDSNRDEKDND